MAANVLQLEFFLIPVFFLFYYYYDYYSAFSMVFCTLNESVIAKKKYTPKREKGEMNRNKCYLMQSKRGTKIFEGFDDKQMRFRYIPALKFDGKCSDR